MLNNIRPIHMLIFLKLLTITILVKLFCFCNQYQTLVYFHLYCIKMTVVKYALYQKSSKILLLILKLYYFLQMFLTYILLLLFFIIYILYLFTITFNHNLFLLLQTDLHRLHDLAHILEYLLLLHPFPYICH